MKIAHTKNFDINIPDALDALEEEIRKYPDLIGLEPEEMEELDVPAFWGEFWVALLSHAADIYEADVEEGEEGFAFDSRLTLDELETSKRNSGLIAAACNLMEQVEHNPITDEWRCIPTQMGLNP